MKKLLFGLIVLGVTWNCLAGTFYPPIWYMCHTIIDNNDSSCICLPSSTNSKGYYAQIITIGACKAEYPVKYDIYETSILKNKAGMPMSFSKYINETTQDELSEFCTGLAEPADPSQWTIDDKGIARCKGRYCELKEAISKNKN